MTKIKVLHIIKSLGRGGAEMLLPETLKIHHQDRFEFHYIYFLPWKDQMVEAIQNAGGKVTCLPAKNNLQLLLKYRDIVKYCKKHHIQLIHAHLPWAGIVARLAGKKLQIPVIYTEHNNFDKYNIVTRFLSTVTYRYQQKVIAVSEDAQQALLRRKLFHDIEYVPNGVNTTYFNPDNRFPTLPEVEQFKGDNLLIGSVAVFRKQKRLDRFLEVARLAQQQNLPMRFLLVGDGPERPLLERLRDENKLTNVFWAGLQEHPVHFMQYLDVFLITSDFEGLPVALLETMAMEIIPCSTPVGGIPNVVHHQSNGILCSDNDPEAILKELQELGLKPEVQKTKMKQEARATIVQHYSIERMVKQLESIYIKQLQHESGI
jgi:L-malate glycosyltransferase